MTKLQYPTFDVTLWDAKGEAEETLTVRAAPFAKIEEIKALQLKLMEAFVAKDGCLSELIGDKDVYATMQRLAGLLRVVGLEKSGLDISSLYSQGDIVQLGQIFFTEAVTADMRSPGYTEITTEDGQPMMLYQRPPHRQNPTPSAIARIHDLPFFDLLIKIREKSLEAQEQTKPQAQNPVATVTST